MSIGKLSHIYSGDVKQRATSSESLMKRLDINRKYQSKDFGNWLFKRLQVLPGEKVLDVGCGTGAQSLRFLEEVGKRGRVDAIDLSEDSVNSLIKYSENDPRLNVVAADMGDLECIIADRFKSAKYTLAHSSYALYYSPSRLDVLRTMIRSLHEFGRLAVFTPVTPHGMVDIASKFGDVPEAVLESLRFGPDVLESEFRNNFWDVEIHYFQSEMRVPNKEDFITFYKATTYFNENSMAALQEFAENEISTHGAISYEKNGYLIIGRDAK